MYSNILYYFSTKYKKVIQNILALEIYKIVSSFNTSIIVFLIL
jgi:hypothetical protein